MRRLNDDDGAVAVVFALFLSLASFGLLAISVDVGAAYSESRQLQNGAEAAALAAARDCANATTPCTSSAEATSTAIQGLANDNANDGAAAIDEVCGSGGALTPCAAAAAAPAHWDCGPAPASGNYAQVRTSTRMPDGSTLLPSWFLHLLPGAGSYVGSTVRSCARAAWGPAGGLNAATMPFTISLCEWTTLTSGGQSVAPPPPYPPWPTERALYLHTSTQAGSCNQGPSGADLAGGFGWLQTDSTCTFTQVVDGWYADDTGRPPPTSCADEMTALRGHVINIPLYDDLAGTGSNGTYRLAGFAPFYLTGYYALASDNLPSLVNGVAKCPSGSSSDTCIKGFFTSDVTPVAGTIGTGPDYGTVVVQLTG